jgi:hypothetical protein
MAESYSMKSEEKLWPMVSIQWHVMSKIGEKRIEESENVSEASLCK